MLIPTGRFVFLKVCPVFCLLLTAPALAQDTADDCLLCAEIEQVVSRYGLRESPTPVRERENWSPPKQIVTVFGEPVVSWFRQIAPDAEVISLRQTDDPKTAMSNADVFIGQCSPDLAALGTELKWIQTYRAGVDSCTAHPEFTERDILVTNGQRISGSEIGEHAIALMLGLAHKLDVYANEQAAGEWARDILDDTQVIPAGLWEVEDLTMLVVGLGGIGTEAARRAHGLGMRVIATRNSRREGPDFVDYVGLSHELVELAAQADVVVSALPLPRQQWVFSMPNFSRR